MIVSVLVTSSCVYETPDDHPSIGTDERQHIKQTADVDKQARTGAIPWCQILKSPQVWAAVMALFTLDYSNYFMMTALPQYVHDASNPSISTNGLISALPWVLFCATAMASSIASDYLQNQQKATTTLLRKLTIGIGTFVPGLLFLVIILLNGRAVSWAMGLIFVIIGFEGVSACTSLCNTIDLSRNYVGIIYGIANTVAGTAGILAPTLTGVILSMYTTVNIFYAWNLVFATICAVNVFCGIFFLLFGSGDRQSWDRSDRYSELN